MNIAIVLYGQPRDYLKGYNNIIKFINTHKDCKFDFFYHCWILNENEKYKCSPWRNIDEKELIYNKNTISDLKKLYNPVLYENENQNELSFDESLYKNTIAFNNTYGLKLTNINNTLFQMYSRNKARNLLHSYLEKMDNKVHYDFVIFFRFDISNSKMPKVKFSELDKSRVYTSYPIFNRKYIDDNFIIAPTNIFLEWFNIYDRLKDILNNQELLEKVVSLNEKLQINAEELILAKYIFHYQNIENISYFQNL